MNIIKGAPDVEKSKISLTFRIFSDVSPDAGFNRKAIQKTPVLFHGYGTSFIWCVRPLEPTVALTERNRQKPIPSTSNPLIRSFFTPQKRNRVPSSRGSRPYARRTVAARPSIPLRRSVLPQARTTRRIPPASLSMLNRREDHGQGSLTGCVSDVDLALPELNHGLRRKRRVRIVRRIRR